MPHLGILAKSISGSVMAGLPARLPYSGLPIIDSDHSELEFGIETHGCGTAVDLHNLPF